MERSPQDMLRKSEIARLSAIISDGLLTEDEEVAMIRSVGRLIKGKTPFLIDTKSMNNAHCPTS